MCILSRNCRGFAVFSIIRLPGVAQARGGGGGGVLVQRIPLPLLQELQSV